MLVLSRRESEGIWIDGRVYVKVLNVNRGRAKLGIEAPDEVPVIREELLTNAHPQAGPSAPSQGTCGGKGRREIQDARSALEKARVALTSAAPFLPPNSAADKEATMAIAWIHDVLQSANS